MTFRRILRRIPLILLNFLWSLTVCAHSCFLFLVVATIVLFLPESIIILQTIKTEACWSTGFIRGVESWVEAVEQVYFLWSELSSRPGSKSSPSSDVEFGFYLFRFFFRFFYHSVLTLDKYSFFEVQTSPCLYFNTWIHLQSFLWLPLHCDTQFILLFSL